MGRAIVFLLVITLAGCFPDQVRDMADCKSQVIRFYPGYIAANLDDPGTRYIIGCMVAKGYDFDVTAANCNSRDPLPTQPACYAPQKWLPWAIDRFRRAVK
jgi:hypothetical protein